MSKIFIGMLLIFIDFDLNFGASKIGLLPDFIGFILVHNGVKELLEESQCFNKVLPFIQGMAIYNCVLYIMDFLGLSSSLSAGSGTFLFLFLGFISLIITNYIHYEIIQGIKDIEMNYSWDLNSETLFSSWKILVICEVFVYLIAFIPFLNVIGLIVVLITKIYYLYCFSKSKNLYYNQMGNGSMQ